MRKNPRLVNIHNAKIIDYMYREEERHFRESLDDEGYSDKEKFMTILKEHILYSVIHMMNNYNRELVENWVEEYWNKQREEYLC